MYKVQYNTGITFSLFTVGTMMSAVNTPTIPKYHKPLDWTGINYRVYLFASVRRGAGIRGLMFSDT
jgi:hypothetical protein